MSLRCVAEVGGRREAVMRVRVRAPTDGHVITVRKSMFFDLWPPHTFINLAAGHTHVEGIHRQKKHVFVQQVVNEC